MSEVHLEEHSSPIKTPKQLIIVILLAFLVPIILIVMLSQLITTGIGPGRESQGATTDEAVAARLKPIGQVEVTDPNAPKVEKTGKEIDKDNIAKIIACHRSRLDHYPIFCVNFRKKDACNPQPGFLRFRGGDSLLLAPPRLFRTLSQPREGAALSRLRARNLQGCAAPRNLTVNVSGDGHRSLSGRRWHLA